LKTTSIKTVFAALGVLAFAACTEICDDPPVDELNALYLELKEGGDDGFSPEVLNSAFIVRYWIVPGDSLTFPQDTINAPAMFTNGLNRLRISNGIPFQNDSLFYPRYNYVVFSEADTTLELKITNIDLESGYIGECEYENRIKTFDLNGTPVNQSKSTDYYLITQ
jgi:hypothetical protein